MYIDGSLPQTVVWTPLFVDQLTFLHLLYAEKRNFADISSFREEHSSFR